jgi:hypothetical protein
LDTRTFNNQGTANFLTGGRLYFANGAVFNNSGTANSGNNADLYAYSGQTGTFNNAGTFNKLANHDFRAFDGITFNNAGIVNIYGPIGFGMHGGQFKQIGGVLNLISADGQLWTNSLPHLLEGGVVRGVGSLSSEGTIGTSNTGAQISPGAAPAAAGTLTIWGSYTQGAGGSVKIELGGSTTGTQYDRLVVNGAATLAGTLNVSAINGYVPPADSQYTVLTYQSHSGSFGSVTSGYDPTYGSTDLTLTATGTACIGFSDVPPGSTYYPYVSCLAERDVVGGYADCTFRPANPVTRGQLSKIVSLAAAFYEGHSEQTFEDVPVGSTFHLYVERLASRGIISGYACGGPGEPCIPPGNRPYFRPNANVTRGQTAKLVAIAANLPAPPQGQRSFEDVPEGSTFWQWIEELSTAGAINGYPCGGAGEPCVPPGNRPYFRAGNNVTRGQSAKIVANTFFPDCQTR